MQWYCRSVHAGFVVNVKCVHYRYRCQNMVGNSGPRPCCSYWGYRRLRGSMGTDYGEFVVHSRAHRSRLKQLHGTLVFNDAISFEFIENSLDLSTRTRFTISIFYRYYLILRFEFLYSQINIRKESNSIQIFKADYRLLSRNVFLLWSLCKTFCN